jgi:maltose O-acetyltransferase
MMWRNISAGYVIESSMKAVMRSEREKMLAGELYDALDAGLVRARNHARDLCQTLNASREGDQALRKYLCAQLFGKGGETVWMQPPFYCDYGSNIELGERVFFNFNCIVLDVCRVTIGDYALFGPAVQILTPVHPLDADLRRQQEYGKPIDIGSDVWVGGGALILAGVRIGSRSVIGAGSVVTRDIPAGVFAAGNPCRVIREIADGKAELSGAEVSEKGGYA